MAGTLGPIYQFNCSYSVRISSLSSMEKLRIGIILPDYESFLYSSFPAGILQLKTGCPSAAGLSR